MRQVGEMSFQSHSQAGQDLFAYAICECVQSARFVDIGSNDAKLHSNSYALETYANWRGLLIDTVGGCESRQGTFIQCDAANPNDRLKFFYGHLSDVTHYLSLDVDQSLLPVFQAIPWDKTKFKVITLEHDYYCRGPQGRDQTRQMLSAMGYLLLCADVRIIAPGETVSGAFEDFWVSESHISPELVKRFRCENKEWQHIAEISLAVIGEHEPK